MEILEEREFIVEVGNFYRIQSEELEKNHTKFTVLKTFLKVIHLLEIVGVMRIGLNFLGILKTDYYIFIIKCLSSKY